MISKAAPPLSGIKISLDGENDKLPANAISSLKSIVLPPVTELNASAYTVPEALILPVTVRASFGVAVLIPKRLLVLSQYNSPLLSEPTTLVSVKNAI